MVEQSAALQKVSGSNPVVPYVLNREKPSEAFTSANIGEEKTLNILTEAKVASRQVKMFAYKDCAVSRMKVTQCKAEWYSIHLRSAKSLRQNNSLHGKPICSVSVGSLSKKSRNIILRSRKDTLLTNMCTWVKTGCFVELRNSRKYDPKVE